MKNYIDVDLLKSELEDLNESRRFYYMGVFDIINSQPTADIAAKLESDSEHCDILYKFVLDLINCQKAEIEELKTKIEELKTEIDKLEN